MKRKNVRAGIRSQAGWNRVRPERSTLDCSAILTFSKIGYFTLLFTINYCVKWKGKMSEVGLERKPVETDGNLNAAS